MLKHPTENYLQKKHTTFYLYSNYEVKIKSIYENEETSM